MSKYCKYTISADHLASRVRVCDPDGKVHLIRKDAITGKIEIYIDTTLEFRVCDEVLREEAVKWLLRKNPYRI